jgi:hypothetical protein
MIVKYYKTPRQEKIDLIGNGMRTSAHLYFNTSRIQPSDGTIGYMKNFVMNNYHNIIINDINSI